MTTLYIHDYYIGMIEPRKVYAAMQHPFSEEWIIGLYIQNGDELTLNNHLNVTFPNPFDAYSWLLENIKEEEIV